MHTKNSYNEQNLLDCGHGKLFGENNARLPIQPMLMVDRIVNINNTAGEFGKGIIEAELDIKKDLWFFGCHFVDDPVMPGCLGLDAMWQLLGFFLGWQGGNGRGRALGCSEVKFNGQILPDSSLVSYCIDVKRVVSKKIVVGVADGKVYVDGKKIYIASDLKVGLFK